MPPATSSFVAEELLGIGVEACNHRFGCRIMSRLVKYSGNQPVTIQLIGEALEKVGELSRHEFGHHVVESILEHGSDSQKHSIVCALQSDIFQYAMHSRASYVIEKAFGHCSVADRDSLVASLHADNDSLLCLAGHNTGFYVVQALLPVLQPSSPICKRLRQESPKRPFAPRKLQTSGNQKWDSCP